MDAANGNERHSRRFGFRTGSCGAGRADCGFSVVELMVTLAVAAILVALAVPAMRKMLQEDSQWTQANTLVIGLNAARSEARKEDVSVSLCPSTDGLTCGGTSWATGWVVLSAAPPANSVGPVMAGPALPNGSTLSSASTPGGTAVTSLTFLSNGMILLNNTLSSNVAFTICDSRGVTHARSIEVTLAGRVSSSSTPGKTVGGAAIAGC